MNDADIAYFRRRENEERRRADQCSDNAVSRLHREMADHYGHKLSAANPRQP